MGQLHISVEDEGTLQIQRPCPRRQQPTFVQRTWGIAFVSLVLIFRAGDRCVNVETAV